MAIQPERFEHLYAAIALCQPLLHSYIPRFIERKQDPGFIHHFHPALADITADTYGLVLYQEQVMQIAHKIAGFSYAQADSFRRTLRPASPHPAHTYKNEFIAGVKKFGLSPGEAINLFDYVAQSEPCSYNKSHVVAFATIAYQTAWLKANYSL